MDDPEETAAMHDLEQMAVADVLGEATIADGQDGSGQLRRGGGGRPRREPAPPVVDG